MQWMCPLSTVSSARRSRGRMSSCPQSGCGGSGIRRKARRLRSLRARSRAQRILSLLIRHANVIAFTLTQTPQYYEPLFLERKVKGRIVSIVDEWCCGYVKGIALDPLGWQPLIEARPDWFEVIRLYGTKSGWDRLKELVDAHEDAIARHQAFVDLIAPAARNIHAYWVARRAQPGEAIRDPRQPIHKIAVPGCNDLCPCGSGKKFKRCHGAPSETAH